MEYLEQINKEQVDRINEEGVEIVISARNEAKTLPLTITNLMEDMHSHGIRKYGFTVVDNGSEDETSRFFSWRALEKGWHWKYEYSPRGMINERVLRVIFDPVMSNVGARTKGVDWARYENIIFADAHIIVRPGTILSTLSALNKFGGLIHAPVSWMGASSFNPKPGYQYSYKVGEKGPYGTWNSIKLADTPFYIPLCGHCWVGVKRKEFIEKKGYPLAQRVYGGGEPYLDSVWWMTGSTSMCDPGSLVYHLSAGRGYNWHSNDLLHNSFLVANILSGQKLADRILITYVNKMGSITPTLEQLYKEALEEGAELKDWLDENKIMTFEEMLALNQPNDRTDGATGRPHAMRPWDTLNEALHGTHGSFVQEFKLERRDGKIYIGNTEITAPQAIKIAEQYV